MAFVLFELDNTLYHRSTGVMTGIERRIRLYVAHYLRRMGFRGKPNKDAYLRILADLGFRLYETVDSPTNITGFRNVGGRGIHVGEGPLTDRMAELDSLSGRRRSWIAADI